MSEQFRHKEALPLAPAEQDILVLIRKMQQQLVFLEKKMDILIGQSSGRPYSEKHFSKPFRSFGRSDRYSGRGQVNASGEKSFERGRHFEKRHSEENRGFDHKKKAYDNSRESGIKPERHFEKRPEGEKRGFDPKKKPFSYRRKDPGGYKR